MKRKLIRTIIVVLTAIDVFLSVSFYSDYYYGQPIEPNFSLPEPIKTGVVYDYCERNDSPKGASEQVTEILSEGKMFEHDPRVVPAKNFKRENYHVVLVGVGIENNDEFLEQKSGELENIFTDVNIDFAHLKDPVNIDFLFSGRAVILANWFDEIRISDAIRTKYQADGILIFINSDRFFGRRYNDIVMVPTNHWLTNAVAAHETAHLLGLGEGYRDYLNDSLPNSELFYIDKMPRYLVNAVNKLDEVPPVYEAGTCRGEKVYTFYRTENNIMGNYSPVDPNPWGKSIFTPLQIWVMNDYIKQTRQ